MVPKDLTRLAAARSRVSSLFLMISRTLTTSRYVYDMRIPNGVVVEPTPSDGEVQSFEVGGFHISVALTMCSSFLILKSYRRCAPVYSNLIVL